MRPLKLELKGFSVFREETVVDFTDVDLFALVGKTGSGKSTVIDGITFALYGSVARLGDNRLVAPAINQTSNEARVRLEFELDGSRYSAVRVVRRTPTGATTREARLERGDEIIADDARNLTAAVEQLLGLDADQFNRTVVLPQGRFADFLHADPRDRQSTLRRLLGVDVYERIGRAARALATRKTDQVKMLQDDLDEELDLSDERRAELLAGSEDIAEIRTRFNTIRDELVAIELRRPTLTEQLENARASFQVLTALKRPDGIDELVQRLDTEAALLNDAAAALEQATDATAQAHAAVESGPDVTALTGFATSHDQLADTEERLQAATSELETVTVDLTAASAAADKVTAEQQRLATLVVEAQQQLNAARDDAAAAPSADQIEFWSGEYATVHTLTAELAAVAARREALLSAETDAKTALDAATDTRDAATAAVSDLERRQGIAAYADALRAGEPCPLCQQTVDSLPEHHVDAELAAAREQLGAATDAQSAAQAAYDAPVTELATNRVMHDSIAAQVAAANDRVGGYPPEDSLAELRTKVDQLAARAERCQNEFATAASAAEAHEADPANVAVLANRDELARRSASLTSQIDTLAETSARLTASLVGAPAADECREQLALASSLTETHRQAVILERERRDAHKHQLVVVDRLTLERDAADALLVDARESVVSLGAPRLDGASLADNWSILLDWATEQSDQVRATGEATRQEVDALEAEVARKRGEVVALVTPLGYELTAHQPVDDAAAAIDEAVSDAREALRRFDAERTRRADVLERIEQLSGEAAVAAKLGHLMRSDGFERWFMQTALADLAERATTKLMELSGGMYSLVLSDRVFEVCDHANADELRSARTLSGGETFLASLALALALAEATADLSPEHVPKLESIFLDEGFGTLDSDTLDVVSAAIEELGAGGRMVGIITHIRELADRMPVRFEVTKLAASSTVERVEV